MRLTYICTLLVALSLCSTELIGRSVHRTPDPLTPEIEVFSSLEPHKIYRVQSWHLLEHPYFGTFHKDYFYQNLLPQEVVEGRNTKQLYSGLELNNLIEKLYQQILRRERGYQDFTVLMDKDFNYVGTHGFPCGALVLKFKNYPFVLKLFIETPPSITHHWGKGFVQVFLHYLGGGANRHLSGFTRPLNAEYIRRFITENPELADQIGREIDTPKKFFWIPRDPLWLTIKSTNIGKSLHQEIEIPAVYGIIADAIEAERTFSKCSSEDVWTAMTLHSGLNMWIDPHIDNFMVEKNSGKLVIIDTEHFPTMVGLDVESQEGGYVSWLFYLTRKCAKHMLFSTKRELRARATEPTNSMRALVPFV